jgi:hypothetical protein
MGMLGPQPGSLMKLGVSQANAERGNVSQDITKLLRCAPSKCAGPGAELSEECRTDARDGYSAHDGNGPTT